VGCQIGGRAGPSSSAGIDWGELYGRLCTTLGKLPAEIDDLYLWEVEELFDYWTRHPPVHELVAGYMGYKPPARADQQTAEDFASFFAEMTGALPG